VPTPFLIFRKCPQGDSGVLLGDALDFEIAFSKECVELLAASRSMETKHHDADLEQSGGGQSRLIRLRDALSIPLGIGLRGENGDYGRGIYRDYFGKPYSS